MKRMFEEYNKCLICPRECGVNRNKGERGVCASSSVPRIAAATLHLWEEPVISGARGSGTVFFSGCSLKCLFCQNRQISRDCIGKEMSADELADLFLSLEKQGAHNINLVTPTHFTPHICRAVDLARENGLNIPIVYNTSSYDKVSSLEKLQGRVDIYLADFKYYLKDTAKKFSKAENYPDVARAAIAEMVKQQPTPVIENGLMKKGVIVRILLLPAHLAEAKLITKELYRTYGDSIYVSLMNQYTPPQDMSPPLNRPVTKSEYNELVDYAIKLGIKNCFIQEDGTVSESFIPLFAFVE